MVDLTEINNCIKCTETSTPVFSQLVHDIGFPGREEPHVKIIEGTTVSSE